WGREGRPGGARPATCDRGARGAVDGASPVRRLPTSAAMVRRASCRVGPNYTRPTVPLPGRYAEAVTSSGVRDPQLAHWWTRFEDPLLDQLIDRALAQNLDVEAAAARIR